MTSNRFSVSASCVTMIVFASREGRPVAIDNAAQTTSDGMVLRAGQPAPSQARPVSARRQALQAQPDGGRAELAAARRTLGGVLQAHALAPLAALRHRAGLSQMEAAEATGIKQPHISRLENGQVPQPDLNTLRALANAYGCGFEALLQALDATVQPDHG